MWNIFRNRNFLNLKFRRQHLIEGYLIDFYCHDLKLAIEIDGGIHTSQEESDSKRQKVIERCGITFYRIKSEHVEYNIKDTLIELAKYLKNLNKENSETQ